MVTLTDDESGEALEIRLKITNTNPVCNVSTVMLILMVGLCGHFQDRRVSSTTLEVSTELTWNDALLN